MQTNLRHQNEQNNERKKSINSLKNQLVNTILYSKSERKKKIIPKIFGQ